MWLYLQKQLATFETLYALTKQINSTKAIGGATIDVLYCYYTMRSG